MAQTKMKSAAPQDPIVQIQDLERTVLSDSASKERRLAAAQTIHDIGIGYAWDSKQRIAAANSLFKAYTSEDDPDARDKLRIMIYSLGCRLGYSSTRTHVQDSPQTDVTQTYSMSGPFPPSALKLRKKPSSPQSSPKAEAPVSSEAPEATKAPEATQPPSNPTDKEPKRIRLGIWNPLEPDARFNLTLGVRPTKEDYRAWEKSEREAKETIPTDAEGRARRYIARLPEAKTPAGWEAEKLIGEGALLADARKRTERIRTEPIPKEDLRTVGGLSIWPPPWVPVQRWFKIVNEPDSKGMVYQPEPVRPAPPITLAAIDEKDSLSPVDKKVLIATLDDNDSGSRDRLKAVMIIMKHRMAEAIPLLNDIIRDPHMHEAYEDLVDAARDALRYIRTG